MFKKIVIGISFVVATVFSTVTIGEDAVIADPQHYTVEFENDKVRVIRIKYGPREAYRFARGEQVVSSTGQPVRLSRPLDWLVIADHSDGMGMIGDTCRYK